MGEFGNQNIDGLIPGKLPGEGTTYKLASNDDQLLQVVIYDSSNNFVRSSTLQVDNGVADSDPSFVRYYQYYDGLKIGNVNNTSGIQLNLQAILKSLSLPQGVYHVITNIVTIIDPGCTIQTISQDRTEVMFRGIPGEDDGTDIDFGNNTVPSLLGNHKVDLGNGRFTSLVNWTKSGFNLISKLKSPLPLDTFPGGTYPLYMDVTDPVMTKVMWEVAGDNIQYPFLAPNFDLKVRAGTPIATDFKTSDDLTGTVKQTKDKILNKYLSQSYGETEVNIDYQNPSEFIHFSSYEERVLNFKYKIQLLEKYSSEISSSDTITGDVATSLSVTTDRAKIVSQQDDIIGSFDKFEQYMYNESSSYISGSLGEYWPNTWPKSTTVPPHRIMASTSSEASVWLSGAIQSASFYDRMNPDLLSKALPNYILEDESNSTIITLTDMIGQHYDVVWTYVKGLTDVSSRDEALTTGIAKNLLWHVGTSLGMQLPNGNAAEDLWKWALGTDSSGSVATTGTGFASGSLPQLSSEDVTKNIWSRLINNLPYFLRTKGTQRGLKAVLSCYGVPDTIIQVREYGGPTGIKDTERQFMQEERATYAVQMDRGETFQLKAGKQSGTELSPRAIQFRFKTDQKDDQVLLEKNGAMWALNLHHSSSITQLNYNQRGSANIPVVAQSPTSEKGVYGRLTFLITGSNTDDASGIMSASTEYLPLHNGDWWNVTLQTEVTSSTTAGTDNNTGNQRWHIHCSQAKDHANGTITHSGSATLLNHTGSYSASFNSTWREFNDTTYWNFGGYNANSNATRYSHTGVRGLSGIVKQFSGSMQEIRLWGGDALTKNVRETHTLSPRSYVGNNFSSSYEHLWARFPLGNEFKKSNLSGSIGTYTSPTIISSSHTNQDYNWSGGVSALHLSASGFSDATTGSNGTHFEPMTETYYTTLPSYPSNGISSTKIRLEEAGLTKMLSPFERAELSEYDRHPKDTNHIGVHLSLQHQINRDIAYQFGGMRVDDYIGDPEHQSLDNYPDLEQLSNFYFKKLYAKPDMADFARMLTYYDASMFEMVKRMMPARANSYVGLLVEPHILERNKIQRLPELSEQALHYEGTLAISETMRGKTFPLSMSADVVSEYSASLKTAGGDNWFALNAQSANPTSFGDLSDGITIGHDTGSYHGARYKWTQDYRNKNADGTFTTGSYVHTSDPLNTVVTGSRLSELWETRVYKYSSSFSASWDSDRGIMAGTLGYGLSEPKALLWNTYKKIVVNGEVDRQQGKAHIYPLIGDVPRVYAERQDTDFTGFFNARYGGSKLSANGYNQDSPQTSDGSPVIEIFDSNPNQLIVTSPSVYGGSLTVPGITKFPGKGQQGFDKFGNPVMLIQANSPAATLQGNKSNITNNPGGQASADTKNSSYS